MKKYIEKNDTRKIYYEYAYDEDRRLCEVAGCDLFISEFSIDGYIYNITVPEIYLSGNRQFSRYIRKHMLRPYMKIRKIKDNNIVGMCRIYIHRPKYLTGFNENMILDSYVIDKLIDILNTHDDTIDYIYPNTNIKNKIIWTHMIMKINHNYKMCNISYKMPTSIRIPDYYKLLVDVKKK